MIANTDILLSELECAVCAVFDLSEQYKLFSSGLTWKYTQQTIEAWKKAIALADKIATVMLDEDVDLSFDDVDRIFSLLTKLRELRSELPAILTQHKDFPSNRPALTV